MTVGNSTTISVKNALGNIAWESGGVDGKATISTVSGTSRRITANAEGTFDLYARDNGRAELGGANQLQATVTIVAAE